jgi:biotin transport system ATP-binding protein
MSDTSPERAGGADGADRGALAQTIVFSGVSVVRDGRTALDRVSIGFEESRIGIVGLNGSGKSTLLKCIIGLVKPSAGTITVDGRDAIGEARTVRRSTGFLFQDPDNQIVMPLVAEDLAFGLKNHGFSKAETAERVDAALARLAIRPLADRRIHELSGGEKQLVALAGVLALTPKTVLFDEPTAHLDLKNRNRLRDVLHAMPEQAIVVSHDLDLLADFPRVVLIEAGRIVRDGPAEEVLAHYREASR